MTHNDNKATTADSILFVSANHNKGYVDINIP